MTDTVDLARTDAAAALPNRATTGSFGYDLATLRSQRVGARETTVLATGLQLAADLPHLDGEGVAMMLLPRSSLPLKYGLILPNSPGLIDADYSEEIGIIVHNLRDEEVHLEAGTRVAQAVFVRVVLPRIDETPVDPSRRRSGFGSTGS